jgi:hypothetical protein
MLSTLTLVHLYIRSATGNASTRGANNTVNGYMSFILFSVAGLACECHVIPPGKLKISSSQQSSGFVGPRPTCSSVYLRGSRDERKPRDQSRFLIYLWIGKLSLHEGGWVPRHDMTDYILIYLPVFLLDFDIQVLLTDLRIRRKHQRRMPGEC